MNGEKHLTPDELAARWDIHKATVLRMFHDGILPGIIISQGKTRKTVRFRLATVEVWEKKRERAQHDKIADETVCERGAK